MQSYEWVVWWIFLLIVVFVCVTWLIKKRDFPTGKFYDTTDVITLIAIPKILLFETILLIIFLVLEINKFHLLWIFPIIWLAITMIMTKKIIKRDGLSNSGDSDL